MTEDLFLGDNGVLLGHRLVPDTRMRQYGRPPEVLPRSPGHDEEFIRACRGGPPAGSDFVAHSGLLTEACLLGNIALRVGRKLLWDGTTFRFTNDEEANRLLHRAYREGWTLDT
jgi:hypothetical protein